MSDDDDFNFAVPGDDVIVKSPEPAPTSLVVVPKFDEEELEETEVTALKILNTIYLLDNYYIKSRVLFSIYYYFLL